MSDAQQRLFETDPDPWDLDAREQWIASVVFPEGPVGPFDYLVPENLLDQAQAGRRVRAPLGKANRLTTGYCVALASRIADRPLKPLAEVVDARRLLSATMLRLTAWIAEHYLCPWGLVLHAVVPAGVRLQAGTRLVTLVRPVEDLPERLEGRTLAPKQKAVIEALLAAGRPLPAAELAARAGCGLGPVNTLRRRGLLRAETRRADTASLKEAPQPPRQEHLVLNPDQQRALEAILAAVRAGKPETILVHGVTGSGKTEVYIQAIADVVRRGRQGIVLVPEISLTPQTVERFRARFDRVAVLHSHLSDVERHQHWQRIADGGVQVVVGARSAIFSPTPNAGLIVLDEEHEASFKQDSAPRYHAREVALARSREDRIPLVLGSATPALESWHRACCGAYRLVEMPRRVFDRPLPAVGTLDLRQDAVVRHSRGAVSRQLHVAIEGALRDGGQVILLLNRRGFSTHIQCPACGHAVKCPECEIALTHHRTEEIVLCHYCDYRLPAPAACPACGFAGIRYSGVGTQRLEAEIRARFPGVACLRMDTDSMRSRGAHEKALAAFRSGTARILLGTQMIAKGLDFPGVTLVGVINADMALHLPDFRAAERTFQLVTQVAGRTGRGEKGGRVLVQTFNPDHAAILAAVHHDYAAFAASELPLRQILSYPPFGVMIRLVVRGPKEQFVTLFAQTLGQRLGESLERHAPGARLLGPAPAPFAKLRGHFRIQIQLQGPDGDALRAAVREATAGLEPPEEVQWIVDVDPLDML